MIKGKQQIAKLLIDFNEENPREEYNIAKAFVSFYVKRKQEHQLPYLLEIIEKKNKEYWLDKNFQIFLAQEVSDNLIKKIKNFLNVPASVPEIIKIEPSIKSGFIVFWDQKKYDASLCQTLEKMKNTIKNNIN